MISQIILAFLLGLTCDLLEDRYVDDIINIVFVFRTDRFQVAVHLFSNRSQKMSKCVEVI